MALGRSEGRDVGTADVGVDWVFVAEEEGWTRMVVGSQLLLDD